VNVARAVKALGHASAAFVVVAGHAGRHVVQMIEEADGMRCEPVWVGGMTRTITTVLEESLHRQTAFFEPGPPITDTDYAQIVARCTALLPEARVLTLNGAVGDARLVPLYAELGAAARHAGLPFILDSYGPEFVAGLDACPTLVKPNLAEAESLLGRSLPDRPAQWEAIAAFHARGAANVVLSLGAEGALVSDGTGRWHLQPPAINEVNPVGSGDALVAGLAVGLASGWSLLEGARLGVAAGTANAASWDIGHFSLSAVNALLPEVRVTSC
jgi:1-phosphofructokinase family hexose kinase